jgi:predicted PurR-regulated permease PerM
VEPRARTWQRHGVRLTPATAALIIGTAALAVIARDVFQAAHRVIGWAAAAIVVAALLDLPIDLLARRIGRVAAVALTFVAVAVAAFALVYGVFDDLRDEIERFQDSAPTAAEELETRDDRVGELARDLQLVERTERLVEEIDDRLGGGGGEALLAQAGSLPTYFVGAILTIFLMSYGPRIIRGGLAQIDDEARRQRAAGILGTALVRSRAAILVMMAQAFVVGLIVAATCEALDLPAPLTVALLGAVLGLIPYLGIALAALPVALLAAGFASVAVAIGVLVAAIAFQAVEALWLRPRVDAVTMRIGAAVPWLAGIVGYSVYGIGGALYGAAYAVFALAIIDALGQARQANSSGAAMIRSSS